VPDLRFSSLSPVYARLASGDAVKAVIRSSGRPLPGRFFAYAVVDETPLPLVTTVGQAPTPGDATTTVTRGARAFTQYVAAQQKTVPKTDRVELALVSAASSPTLIDARKKTLPVFVFLAVMSAFAALAFVIDNVKSSGSRRVSKSGVAERPQSVEPLRESPDPVATAPLHQPQKLSAPTDTLHQGTAERTSANPSATRPRTMGADGSESGEGRPSERWAKRSTG
jgi:hypothetical protein